MRTYCDRCRRPAHDAKPVPCSDGIIRSLCTDCYCRLIRSAQARETRKITPHQDGLPNRATRRALRHGKLK